MSAADARTQSMIFFFIVFTPPSACRVFFTDVFSRGYLTRHITTGNSVDASPPSAPPRRLALGQSLPQPGIAELGLVVANGGGQGPPRPHEDDAFPAAGDRRVEQAPLQHNPVVGRAEHNHV